MSRNLNFKKMKLLKPLAFLLLGASFIVTMSSSVPATIPTEAEISKSKEELKAVPIEQSLNSMTASEFTKLTARDYKKITGERLSLKEKLILKSVQKETKSLIAANKLDENTKMNFSQQMADGEKSFDFGGFIVGFLFGLIGVGLVHIFSTSKAARRSSWQGLGAWILLLLALLLI